MAQGALVDVVLGERDVRHGVRAHELLELRPESARWISASALERWLIESGFAEPNGEPGRLVPTNLAIEVAGALDFLGSWREM